jgi:hypothetical protein
MHAPTVHFYTRCYVLLGIVYEEEFEREKAMNGIRCKQRGDLSPQCASNQDLKVCLEVDLSSLASARLSCCRAFDLPHHFAPGKAQSTNCENFPLQTCFSKKSDYLQTRADGKYVCYVLVRAVFTMHNLDLGPDWFNKVSLYRPPLYGSNRLNFLPKSDR